MTERVKPDDASWKERPRFVRLLQRRIDEVRRGKRYLESLEWTPVYKSGEAMERKRSMRRERRLACLALLDRYAEFMSVASRIVFHRAGEGIIGVKLASIAEWVDMGDRRIDRAQRELRAAGYVETWERAEYDRASDRHIGLAAIRQISRKLLDELGLAEQWDHFSRKRKGQAAKALQRPSLQHAPQSRRRLTLGLRSLPESSAVLSGGELAARLFRPPD